eukprot:gene26878-34723_t
MEAVKALRPEVLVFGDYSIDKSTNKAFRNDRPHLIPDMGRGIGAVNENKVTEVSVNLAPNFSTDPVPVSFVIYNEYNSLLSRLSLPQQLVLRVASIVGAEFRSCLLISSFPVPKLRSEIPTLLMELVDLGFLYIVPNTLPGDERFGFTSRDLHLVTRDRVTVDQVDLVTAAVTKQQEEIDNSLSRKAMASRSSRTGPSLVLMSGNLEMRVLSESGDWKTRFVTVRGNELLVFENKHHFVDNLKPPVYELEVSAEAEAISVHEPVAGRTFVFRASSCQWSRDGVTGLRTGDFFFACPSLSSLWDWVKCLKLAANAKLLEAPSGPVRGDAITPVLHNGPAALKQKSSCDIALSIRVQSIGRFTGDTPYGAANSYVRCRIGEISKSTTCKGHGDSWGEELVYELNRYTWAKECLNLSLWNKSCGFLTDDFLGEISESLVRFCVPMKGSHSSNSRRLSLRRTGAGGLDKTLDMTVGAEQYPE